MLNKTGMSRTTHVIIILGMKMYLQTLSFSFSTFSVSFFHVYFILRHFTTHLINVRGLNFNSYKDILSSSSINSGPGLARSRPGLTSSRHYPVSWLKRWLHEYIPIPKLFKLDLFFYYLLICQGNEHVHHRKLCGSQRWGNSWCLLNASVVPVRDSV